jgi:hypothetical protein
VRLGEDRDELRLGPVRVLELVDEDVAEAGPQLRTRRRGRPDEAQREADLVTEVDEAGRREQLLVAGVGPGQLAVSARLLRKRLIVRIRTRPDRELVGMGEVRGRRDVLVLAPAE